MYEASPSLLGKVLLLLFDYVGPENVANETTMHCYNDDQNSITVVIFNNLLGVHPGLKGSGIVIITPHRTNLGCLGVILWGY